MKTFFSKTMVWIALSASVFSFAPKPGGNTYKIFLDDKMVTEQMIYGSRTIPPLWVSAGSRELSVYFNHCGKAGTARSLAIRGEDEEELKVWKFSDHSAMKINVSELMTFKRHGTVKLVYTSTEIPSGELLAYLPLSGTSASAKH